MRDSPIPHARALAERLHAGQVDKLGVPYIEHLAAVVAILLRRWPDAPDYAVEAAWLHDALEDTEATLDSLHRDGMSWRVIDLVQELTRPDALAYLQWIDCLAFAGDPWAIRIKLADLEHNCDPARCIPGSDIVERRYEPARRVLGAGLGRCDE